MTRSISRLIFFALFVAAAIGCTASSAAAGVKLALVIGNAKYEAAPALANPANDADDLAQRLRGIGFEVIEAHDASRNAMADAVRQFADRIRSAEVALFFYAGHGLQMGGENYLLPVDAKIETEADVRFNTINLTDIQQEMEGPGRANIIILDACRNNPFIDKLAHSGRGVTSRGLGKVDAMGVGSLIVFSTQPNNVAMDGAGRNSPFMSALLKYIGAPGLEVRQMVSKVRGDVLTATDQKQVPWDNSSLVGDVFLGGAPAVAQNDSPPPKVESIKPSAPAAAEAQPAQNAAPPREAANPPATGLAADCEKMAAEAPPFASPDQIKAAATKDYTAAVEPCLRASEIDLNNPRLQFLLARAYYFGPKNYVEAMRHYKIAADAGFPPAEDALGVIFATGKGVVKDPQRAFDLLNKAALAGDPTGMGDLGVMYASGFFVKADPAQALAWYEKAIEAGNAFVLNNIGVAYFNGAGAERDYNVAAQYFQQAADMNFGYALKFLAIMYERGLLGKADVAKANDLRLKAAQVDPTSEDPVVPPPQAAPRATHAATHRVIRVYRYRFFGCSWVWC
jgi:uncharacterized protein